MPAILSLVREHEFASDLKRDQLQPLFAYSWLERKPALGFVLTAGSAVVGFLGAIYSRHSIDGQIREICNMTTWYVRPDYRASSIGLLMALRRSCPSGVTNFSASADVARILLKFGFQRIAKCDLVYRLSLNPLAALSRNVISEVEAVRSLVDARHRTLLDDHLPYACRHYVVRAGKQYSYIVTKQRRMRSALFANWPVVWLRKRRFPVSYILYLSNPEFAFQHWDVIRWAIPRLEGSLAVAGSEWVLGANAPEGVRIPREAYAFGPDPDPAAIGMLYSETVLLPI